MITVICVNKKYMYFCMKENICTEYYRAQNTEHEVGNI